MMNKKQIIGWCGVGITVIISGFWAYWGTFENFHEGWYSESLFENLTMLIFQYLSLSILLSSLALVTLKWKNIGIWCYGIMAVSAGWFLTGSPFTLLGMIITASFIGLGILNYFGDPQPLKLAYRLIIIVPLIIAISISIPQSWKVFHRLELPHSGIAIVEGNGVALAWAPRGPGWPEKGVTWDEARWICSHLSQDGYTLTREEQNIWRLPNVDEAVRSMMLHNQNVNGEWDSLNKTASYSKTPDKESPLWDKYSAVIYYWTNDTSGDNPKKAMIIVYNGQVHPRTKTTRMDSMSFRAVKDNE